MAGPNPANSANPANATNRPRSDERREPRPPRHEMAPRPQPEHRPAPPAAASPAAVYSPEDEARRSRAALARAFQSSPFKKSAFCALKGMTEAALDTVLAQVRSESPPEPRVQAAAPSASATSGERGTGAWRDRPSQGQNRGRPPRGP